MINEVAYYYVIFVVVFTSILRSRFDREESLQCLREIHVPILSLFGDSDSVSVLTDLP